VLALGAVIQHKPAPEGASDRAADTLWNLDALYENSFAGAGTLDIEGAFYGFDGADAGSSSFVLGSFSFEPQLGFGRLQPMLCLQRAAWGDGETFSVYGTAFFGAAGRRRLAAHVRRGASLHHQRPQRALGSHAQPHVVQHRRSGRFADRHNFHPRRASAGFLANRA
jgi:hypothetical protein